MPSNEEGEFRHLFLGVSEAKLDFNEIEEGHVGDTPEDPPGDDCKRL